MTRDNRFWLAVWFALLGWTIAGVRKPCPERGSPEASKQAAPYLNDLLDVGFTMYDPESHRVERWEE